MLNFQTSSTTNRGGGFVTLALASAALALSLSPSRLRAAEKPATAPVKADGFSFVKTVGAISEYRLTANGLAVLLLPEHSAPVVTFMVTYRVGSRNEVTGTTGATHLLEHLMFKGTENFNRAKGNSIDQLLERVGATYNATTWLDRTNYFATVPAEWAELILWMEADRLGTLLTALDQANLDNQRDVVKNEKRSSYDNQPYGNADQPAADDPEGD